EIKGISIERISCEEPSNAPGNWHSASADAGYATPGLMNSQQIALNENTEFEVIIEPEVFSPDMDGNDDEITIQYRLGEIDFIANVIIFDRNGLIVKKIATNQLLGSQGFFTWDGYFENGRMALAGIYVIYFECFNLKGEVKRTKKTCVLAKK
ncbi:MAG: hypothetical protein HC906_18345, partial [Bacteroidales bacterium]|nr:hypothetical protein [Bacteroidales bacterium]